MFLVLCLTLKDEIMARRYDLVKQRPSRPTIIGAGLTEKWYFTHLNNLLNLKVKIRPRFFGNESIFSLEKRIEQVLRDEGRAIVVFDADVSTWDDEERKKMDALRKKYTRNDHVMLCDSLPSIEYWFLLHYQNTNRYFGTSKAVIEELVKNAPGFDKNENFLSKEQWVADMNSDGKIESAFSRAKSFGDDGESYTHIPLLFEALLPDKFAEKR